MIEGREFFPPEELIKEKVREAFLTRREQNIEQSFSGGIIREQIKPRRFGKRNLIVTQKLEIVGPKGIIDLKKRLRLAPNVFLVRNEYNKEGERIELISLMDEEGKLKGYLIHYGFLQKPGNFLSLFHEIGHIKTARKIRSALERASFKVSQRYRKAEKKTLASDEILFLPEEEKGLPRPLKKNEVEKYIKLRAQEERNAWAWALKFLHRLRQEGFDLEPELTSVNDLIKIVDEHLKSYEEDYILRQGGPSKAKILNLFLKRAK
jgi:hypothetical protein